MKKIWNNKGMVLPTVIIIGAIVIMTGVVLLSMGVLDVKSGKFFERNTQAYMYARSAGEAIVKQIEVGDFVLNGNQGNSYTGSVDGSGVEDYEIYIDRKSLGGTDYEFTITSTGKYQGVEEDVKIIYNAQLGEKSTFYPSTALFAYGDINLNSNAIKIIGDIGTNEEDGSITIKDILYYDNNGNLIKVDDTKDHLFYDMGVSLSPILSMAELNNEGVFTSDINVDSDSLPAVFDGEPITLVDGVLTVEGDASITIPDGNEIELVLNDFISESGTKFDVLGEGVLQIYVRESVAVNGDVNMDEPWNQLNLEIYYDGTSGDVNIDKNGNLCAYFQFLNHDVSPDNIASKSNFIGALVTPYGQYATKKQDKYITINGKASDYDHNFIYAPYAILAPGNGGSEFEGSMIFGEVDGSGNIIISYKPFETGIYLPGVDVEAVNVYELSHWQK
jgi:hypothetical protein